MNNFGIKVLAAILLSSLLFSACSKKIEPKEKTFTVGFSQCTDDMWRQIMMIQMESEASKYPDLELIIKDAHNDTKLQVRQIEEMIEDHYDLIIISPNESQPITSPAVRAYESGIPTIIWDRKINSDKFTTEVSADNYAIGRDAGNYISKILPEGSEILEITGLMGSSPAADRHRGFRDVIDGKYKVRQISGDWSPSVAKARVEALGNYSDIDLVFGHNDDMAIAAYDAISKKSMSEARRIKFIGIDAIVGVDAVLDGRLTASFLYPPGGEFVIQTAMKILHGEAVDKSYTLNSETVDASNAAILKSQSTQILSYQKHINDQRRRISDIQGAYLTMKTSFRLMSILLAFFFVLGGIVAFLTTKMVKKNGELSAQYQEIERKSEELVAQNSRVEYETNRKLQFFTNLTHEIRTPLTLILNPLDKISKSEKDPLIQKDIWTIQRNAQHLLKIVNQILDFRKVENNKMSLTVSEVDIVSFTNEVLKYFEAYAESEKIIYKFSSDISSLNLWIDTDKIEQVLINLISNSFKNLKRYGIITVRIMDNVDSVIIEIHDNGRGISKENQVHIFDRFYSVGQETSHGIGIGLHLTKEYVEMHGGTIKVESEVDKFTSFYIELPKGKKHLPADVKFDLAYKDKDIPENSESDVTIKELLSKKYDETLLIAEDEDEIREYLKEELSANFSVIAVHDGLEAMKKVVDENVAIVLSDVLMPQINGFQLCKNIKTNIATSHIPVVLLTALTDDTQRIYGIAEGADEYIRKPFDIRYLKAKLIRIMEERKNMQKHLFGGEGSFVKKMQEFQCADNIFRDKLMVLLDHNYTDSDFNIESMSGGLGMSRVQIYRKIKEIFGIAPTDLLKRYRLSKAAEMFRAGATQISEVAYSTGFSSPAYFSHCFKEVYGKSPSEYMAH